MTSRTIFRGFERCQGPGISISTAKLYTGKGQAMIPVFVNHLSRNSVLVESVEEKRGYMRPTGVLGGTLQKGLVLFIKRRGPAIEEFGSDQ